MTIFLPPILLLALAKKLSLAFNQIGDIGAEKLAETLPHVTNLTVAWLGSLSWLSAAWTMCNARLVSIFRKLPRCVQKMLPVAWNSYEYVPIANRSI